MSKQLYRIGVTPDCPVHQITVGGQNFTRRSEVVTGYGSETRRREIQGSVVRLDDDDIAKIRKAATRKIVRSTRGERPVSRVHSRDARFFNDREGDVEAGKFIYVHAETVDPTRAHDYQALAADPAPEPTPKSRRRSS